MKKKIKDCTFKEFTGWANARACDGRWNMLDLDKYHKSDRAEFNKAYRKGKLSHYQYMSIAYVLVLGYTQDELAFVMGVDQSVISKNINSGIKRIQRELRAYLEED